MDRVSVGRPKWLSLRRSKDRPSGDPSPTASSTVARTKVPCGIKPLYDSDASAVDIVFVHGLGGDREETWKATDASTPWPQALLPSKVPNARVLTFGYDAHVGDLLGMVSKSRIANHAMNLLTSLATFREDDETNHRPLMFVCHSLGGLVCEDALVTARQRPEQHLREILSLTRGILFLGTPHHGAGLAAWAERLAKSSGILQSVNTDIVRVLRRDSEVLARIQDNFHTMIRARGINRLQPIDITCFYEELPVPLVGLIVPQESAILPGYIPIGIQGNHMEMTKFQQNDDPGFTAVAGELRRWVKALNGPNDPQGADKGGLPPKQGETEAGAQFIVPYASNPGFVRRLDILEKLETHFGFGQHQRPTSQARAALFGLGGVGKTQIALAYAYRVHKGFPQISVFWVHAGSTERFLQSISLIAKSCHVSGHDDPKANLPELVKDWLTRKDQSPWLMILDNADDTDIFFTSSDAASPEPATNDQRALEGHLARYIPECSHGSILVTTRNKETGVRLTRGRVVMEIEHMNPAESRELIQGILDGSPNSDHLALLTERLEYLPLALAQAAAFMQERSVSIVGYLDLLDQGDSNLVELLSQPFEAVGRDSSIPNAITATWMVSFRQIRERYPNASHLLSLMSFFDRQGIPKALLSHPIALDDDQAHALREEDHTMGGIQLENALGVLKGFSFVSKGSTDGTLNMHRLIQLVMRKWLITEQTFEAWGRQALTTVSELYPYADHTNWTVCQDYLPHAYAVLSHGGSSSRVARSSLLHRIACFVKDRGQYNKSEELLVEAVAIKRRLLGEEHPSTLISMSKLAIIYLNQGRSVEAEKLTIQVLEMRKRVLGEEHPHTLASMKNLASTYWNQEEWTKAENLEVQVLEIEKRVLGEEHPETLTSMSNLALTYWNQEEWTKAENLQVQVLEIKKRVLGEEHPETLTSMSNLALTYWNQEEWTKAENLGVQVLEIEKRVLGEEHPHTLTSMSNLVSMYWKQEEWTKAENLGVQVLEIQKRVLGEKHPHTLDSMSNLAIIWKDQGHDEKARELMTECVQLSRQHLGADHRDTEKRAKMLARWTGE